MPTDEHEPLRLLKAIKLATGLDVRSETALRWCRNPNRHGNRLECRKIGNRVYTTVAAVNRFVDSNTVAMTSAPAAPNTSRSTSRIHNQAMKDLDAMGV